MIEKEAIAILAVLKAAYPSQLNKVSENEANGIVQVWVAQFKDIPGNIVLLAAHRLIGISQYFPTISDIKNKIKSLHFDAMWALNSHEQAQDPEFPIGNKLSDLALKKVKYILDNTYDDRSFKREPSFNELIGLEFNAELDCLDVKSPLSQLSLSDEGVKEFEDLGGDDGF